MKGMTSYNFDVIREIFLECSDFRSFTGRLTTNNCANFRRYNKRNIFELVDTRTISFDDLVNVLSFNGIHNKIAPPPNQMAIFHNIDRTSYN
jgi:hypothetical protein